MAGNKKSDMDADDPGPINLPDPDMVYARDDDDDDDKGPFDDIPWLRGLQSLFFLIATYVAGWILGLCTVIQWFWMAIAKEKNDQIAEFGKGLGRWLQDVARFQTGESDEKPFPWKKWGA